MQIYGHSADRIHCSIAIGIDLVSDVVKSSVYECIVSVIETWEVSFLALTFIYVQLYLSRIVICKSQYQSFFPFLFVYFYHQWLVSSVGKVARLRRAPASSTNEMTEGSLHVAWEAKLTAKNSHQSEDYCWKRRVTAEGDLDEHICICIKSEYSFIWLWQLGSRGHC